jgi:hypothetical protein
MKINSLKIISLSLIASLTIVGCGGGGGGSSSDASSTPKASTATAPTSSQTDGMDYQTLFSLVNTTKDKSEIIIDANGVSGLTVKCNGTDITTEQYGLFSCNSQKISVYLGDFKLGSLAKIPDDKIIFTQDIVGVPRAASMYPDVTKISMILQSLDEDGDITNGISITQKSIDETNNELANYSDISELSIEDTQNIIKNVIQQRKIKDPNTKLIGVSEKEAQINLTATLASLPATSIEEKRSFASISSN